MAVQVFVSYCRRDKVSVAALVAFLEKQFVVWWDDDLVSGNRFAEDIFKGLGKTQVAVVAWSRDAAISDWVNRESLVAVERCTTIPVLLDDTPLSPHLAQLDAIDLRGWDGVSDCRELAKLVRDITLHLGAANSPDGKSIAGAQIEITQAGKTPPSSIGTGLLIYVIAHALCFHFVDWSVPFDNLFIWVVLIAANAPLMLNRLATAGMLGSYGSAVPLAQSLSTGGRNVLIVTLAIWLASWRIDFREEGFYGHQSAVQGKLAKLRPAPDLYGLRCSTGWLRNEAAAQPPSMQLFHAERFVQLRGLSVDEATVANGCISDDWTSVSQVADSDIRSPPFVVDFPSSTDWIHQAHAFLADGKFDDARLVLATNEDKSPEARNMLAVLDALRLGYEPDTKMAFLRFRAAAMEGSKVALANVGICYMFGFGVTMDPIYGGELVGQAIAEGAPPDKAIWLLTNGLSLLQINDFAELIKTLRLASARGSAISATIEGVLASHGLTKEPCAPKCSDIARDIANDLKSKGHIVLAAVVEMNAEHKKGKDAVRQASLALPARLQTPPTERYAENVRQDAERRTVEIMKEAARPRVVVR